MRSLSLPCSPPTSTRRRGRRAAAAPPSEAGNDANWVQTELAAAVLAEDFARAAQLRDKLTSLLGDCAAPRDWAGLGLPRWLAARCEGLGFRFPTEVQRRALPPALEGKDLVLRAATGSGKTLALLLPALADLDVLQREAPQVLLLVPNRELGAQHAKLVWRLLGGSANTRQPGDAGNMWAYTGPRGLTVAGCFSSSDAAYAAASGQLKAATLVVGTPAALGRAVALGALPLDAIETLLVDEADACLDLQAPVSDGSSFVDPEVMPPAEDGEGSPARQPVLTAFDAAIFWAAAAAAPLRWRTLLTGATVSDTAVSAAASLRVSRSEDSALPILLQVGTAPLPPSLRHRVLVLSTPADGVSPSRHALYALARLLRFDAEAGGAGPDVAPLRCIVFAPDEASAVDAAEPLRAAAWGAHALSVLLPDAGAEPARALGSFRDGAASLLLTVPACERGLDLPAVRHVYSLAPPTEDASYLHRAGRAGRIGASQPACVTTLVTPAEVPALRSMLARLGAEADEVGEGALERPDADAPSDSARRYLEDLWTLL